jgi:DNA-binding HxlR family transcriptional regulator
MRLKSFADMNCSVAKTIEVIGERWTLLVVREVFLGTRRFEDFRRRLGIARNILTDRLDGLVDAGILERRLYQERPERYEYRLTEKGRDFYPVIMAIKKWGDRWEVGPAGPPLLTRHECGEVIDPVPVCPNCGREVHPREMRWEPGPGATKDEIEEYHRRVALAAERVAARAG